MSGTEFGGPRHIPAPKGVAEYNNQGSLLKQAVTEAIDRVFGLGNLDPSYRNGIQTNIDLLVMNCEMSRDAKRFAHDPNGQWRNFMDKFTMKTIA